MKLRFSIRDLLWLTLVVALCVAWWIDHLRTADTIERLEFDLQSAARAANPHLF